VCSSDLVDLDRAETKPLKPRGGTRGAHEVRQVVPRGTVAEAPEIDARQDDLAVTLRDAAPDLGKNGLGAPAARLPPDERDDTEVARERAAVLDLHEGADAIESRVGLDAADRADVTRDEARRLLARLCNDGDVLGERLAAEVRAAPRHVDAAVRPRGAGGRFARLRERLVRDAAGAD